MDRIQPDEVDDIIDGLDPRFTLVEYGYLEEDGEFTDIHIENATGAYFALRGYDTVDKAWIEDIIPMRRVMMHKAEYIPL